MEAAILCFDYVTASHVGKNKKSRVPTEILLYRDFYFINNKYDMIYYMIYYNL